MSGFTGVPVDALDFYDDLEQDNTKTFWTANKERYEASVRTPMEALCAALEPEFGTAKLFRPYRDVRFAKDKTPYKTHQGAFVSTAEATGLYVQVDAAGVMVAAGWYWADAGVKQRYRRAVDHQRHGRALERLLEDAEVDGYEVGGDRVKTSPRGWDAGHRRIGLLRHNTLTLTRRFDNPAWLATPQAVERIAESWRAGRPLLAWHAKHVGAPAAD